MSRASILVVEDNPVVQQFLSKYLGDRGYSVCSITDNGQKAVELACALQPDLVVMDILLPEGSIDGIESATRIYDSMRIPIVFLSALPEEVDLRRLSNRGSFGVVKKPIEDNELEAAIDMALYRFSIEEKLRQSEEKLNATINGMDDLVMVIDARKIIREFYIPEHLVRFFGTREQNIGRLVGKCLPEGFTHPLEANIRKLQAHGQPVRFDFSVGEGDNCGWFGASISVRHNAAGKYAGLTLVARDITQRVLSEKELHFRQWVLEAVADSSNTLITYPDIEDAIRQSLKRTGEILGFARISVFKNFYDKESRHYYFDQIIRWNRNENAASPPNPELQKVFWLPGLAPWYEKLKSGNIMVTHDAQAIEGGPEIIRKLGIRSLIMVPIHINFFFWGFIGFDGQRPEREFSEFDRHILKTISGTIGGAIDRFDKEQSLMDTEEILSRNIAQLEQSQRDLEQATSLLIQNEKLATLGTIAGSVAHEINSPLGAILNCAERLSESNLSEDQRRQNVKLILNAATRCKYVVEKLLMTSRRSPDQNFCSLNQVINDWFELYGRQLDLLDIAAEVKVPPSVHVKIGYNECSQVLTNVLMNARDALAENPAENRKIILKTTLEGNFALIRISNNGPQIPPGHMEKLFQVFFTSKESGKGTGLGLWICRNILDKAGGSISLRNAAKGVECSIRIPTDPASGKKDEMSLND